MAGEGAEVGVGSGFIGGGEAQHFDAFGVEEFGGEEDALVVGEEVFLEACGAFGHFVGGEADFFEGGADLEEGEVVLGGVGVAEDEFDGFAGPDLQRFLGEEEAFGDAAEFEDLEVLLLIERGI